MATTASGLTIPGSSPTTTAATPIQDHWNNLGKSLNGRIIVPVASVTARAALVSALTAEGYTISASNPLYTHRADAPLGNELEVTVNGTTWDAVNPHVAVAAPTSFGAGWSMTAWAAIYANGIVVATFVATKSSAYTTGEVVFALPPAYCPQTTHAAGALQTVGGAAGPAALGVNTDGTVEVYGQTGGNTQVRGTLSFVKAA